MDYLVIGAGGTGAPIAAFLEKAGLSVSVIARGKHLEAIKKNGLQLTTRKETFVSSVPAYSMEEYTKTPDVIFVTVKGYSLSSILPFLKRIAGKNTIIIPTLNIYGTGARLKEALPEYSIMDGCIYISSHIVAPGKVEMKEDIFRVIFGPRTKEEWTPALPQIADDLGKAGIRAILSENIQRDAFRKFIYISAFAATGAYYNTSAGSMQKEGAERELFLALTKELASLASAMGIDFGLDIVATNLKVLDASREDVISSMQKDLMEGKQSEIDGIVYEVLRRGKSLGLELPSFQKVVKEFKRRGL